MASLLLLTQEQAQHNKRVFESAAAKIPPTAPPVTESFDFEGNANTVSVAHQSSSAASYPPPPGSSIFSDPALHIHALATFFSTAMSIVGFVPNSPVNPPDQQASLFSLFIEELQSYDSFLPRIHSFQRYHQNSSLDCGPLLAVVCEFIEMVEQTMGSANAKQVSAELTNMIVSAAQSIGSSSSARTQKTLYTVIEMDGKSVNLPYPVGTVFWSSVTMKRHTSSSGKSTTVQEHQKIELRAFGYMINSPVVIAHANELAEAFTTSSKELVEGINGSILFS